MKRNKFSSNIIDIKPLKAFHRPARKVVDIPKFVIRDGDIIKIGGRRRRRG